MLRLKLRIKQFRAFFENQKGAVTIDFIALTAMLVVLALATAQAVQTKTDSRLQEFDLTVTS